MPEWGWLTFKNVPLTFKKSLVRAAVQKQQEPDLSSHPDNVIQVPEWGHIEDTQSFLSLFFEKIQSFLFFCKKKTRALFTVYEGCGFCGYLECPQHAAFQLRRNKHGAEH